MTRHIQSGFLRLVNLLVIAAACQNIYFKNHLNIQTKKMDIRSSEKFVTKQKKEQGIIMSQATSIYFFPCINPQFELNSLN